MEEPSPAHRLPRLTSPEEALAFWAECHVPALSAHEREISFVFGTGNHLRAKRVAEHLRQTSDCSVTILDQTTLDDVTDAWWVEGRTRPKVLTEEFVLSLFRWLADTESKFGVGVFTIGF